MARRTHYDVLGVARDASSVDIASAFRDRLADLKASADAPQESIAAVREAYQVLASPERRAQYDESIAPRAPLRPARPVAETAIDAAPAGLLRGRALKYAIPVALAIAAVWGWKTRQKPVPPEARVVSVTRIEETAQAPEPSRAEDARPSMATRAAAAAVSSMTAEQLFATVSPSVVRVVAGDSRQGSGVVIDTSSVVTNCHVIKGAGSVKVKSGSDVLAATVAVADEALDLCTLSVPGLDAPAAALGSVESVRTGQRVYAIGAPMGLELTISEGIVSALREVDTGKVIQTTAPVSPGSSGGGLFAADGQLVGIVTFQHRFGQNLNFALPVDWIAQMRQRSGMPAYAASTPAAPRAPEVEPTVAELVIGTWHCFGPLSGRNGMYSYGPDGVVRIVANDGRNVRATYRVVGRAIQYVIEDNAIEFRIESISRNRMVQFVEAGQRLACERDS